MPEQLTKLQAFLAAKELDCLLVSNMRNIYYFSGFSGSSALLLVFPSKAYLVTDFRYVEQAKQEVESCQVIQHGAGIYQNIKELIGGFTKIGYEENYVTVETYRRMQELIPGKNWLGLQLDFLRMIKTELELALIKKAALIADQAFADLLPELKPGMTELEAAALLEFYLKKRGASRTSFATIVASGKRSSLPHGQPTEKEFSQGDFITFDFGAVYQGYCSDMTRTIVLGQASEKQKEIYQTVLAAQLAALAILRAGLTGSQVDKAARDVINQAGYGEYFGHGTGHSLGLYIHEDPRLAPSSKAVLEPNMVVTVEPGIYLPDWGGVRIEDIAVVKENRAEILTGTDKKLLEIY